MITTTGQNGSFRTGSSDRNSAIHSQLFLLSEGESGPVIEQKKAAAMIRNGSQLSAGHQLGTGGLPVAGGGQSNSPKGRWLFNTEHFSVL